MWPGCVAALAAACSSAPPRPVDPGPAPARAYRIGSSADLLPGIAAEGRIGDYRLDNGVVAVVINAPENVVGFALTGGNLIDAARVGERGRRDSLRQVFLFLDATFPRQGAFDQVAIEAARGNEAVVVATGVDSVDPQLAIRHEYRLGAGDDFLRLRTTITNTGRAPLVDYELGDAVQWGRCQRFIPTRGDDRGGDIEAPWMVGVGDEVAYGYAPLSGTMRDPHGGSWSDPIFSSAAIAPGESATYERVLVIGDHPSVAPVAARLHSLRGTEVPAIRGTVVDTAGAPIANATVEAHRDRALHMTARTDLDGTFELPVDGGTYMLRIAAPGRASVDREATAGAAPVRLTMTAPATAEINVHPPGPAKLTFLGTGDTPNPTFGPLYEARGAANVALTLTGQATVTIPPGTYRVVASRGPEWTIAESAFQIADGDKATASVTLDRAVDTTGYIAGDFHQHTVRSGDSGVSVDDRVISNLAEGVEILVATDHNVVTDFGPTAKALGVSDRVFTVVGLEATSETVGHYNAYPLARDAAARRDGAPDVQDLTARALVQALRGLRANVVVQVNHPRSRRGGYFEIAGFDPNAADPPPDFAEDFDALEVINGKRAADVDALLADWFWFLRRGKRVTAVGNSDSHTIATGEVGYPRTYLGVGFDDPTQMTDDALRDALTRTRDVVVTTGPFVRVQFHGKSVIGKTLRGPVEVVVRVESAPWIHAEWLDIYQSGARTTRAVAPETRVTLEPGHWYVFAVRGDKDMAPVADDVVPFALTNPVWVE